MDTQASRQALVESTIWKVSLRDARRDNVGAYSRQQCIRIVEILQQNSDLAIISPRSGQTTKAPLHALHLGTLAYGEA